MIYIIIEKEISQTQIEIIKFVKQNIKFNNFNYQLIFCDTMHIIESTINMIDSVNDIVLWQATIGYNNLELVKSFGNSIIILEKPSLYIQKISKQNPVNENLAINNGFYIIYINPDTTDITNDDWKLVVQEDMYLMTIEKLNILINLNQNNIRKEKIQSEDIFESITNSIKNQINLS